jgi:ubiquinone/menaquinone biosynthesis C-methylase UbiE
MENNPYPLPNDDQEHHRLDDLQFVIRTLLGCNVIPPISKTATNILDVGAGHGAWCVEVAHQFPTALVRGLDISPIRRVDAPPNCEFVLADLNNGLKFQDGTFDLVNSR